MDSIDRYKSTTVLVSLDKQIINLLFYYYFYGITIWVDQYDSTVKTQTYEAVF